MKPIPVKDAPEVSCELECESLQTGSSTSLSRGLGRECDSCRESGELLASSAEFLTGSSTSLFCGLGRARLKRLTIGVVDVELSENHLLCDLAICSSSTLSSSVSRHELSSWDTCVSSPGHSGVRWLGNVLQDSWLWIKQPLYVSTWWRFSKWRLLHHIT